MHHHTRDEKHAQQIATYSSICETLSVPNFHGAGNISFDAFANSKPFSTSDFITTRTTSPKYFPLMYFSNLLQEAEDEKKMKMKISFLMRFSKQDERDIAMVISLVRK
jgi:hypothetical protein